MSTMLDPLYVSAAYRKPFDLDNRPTVMKFAPDMTLAQMVNSFVMLPPDFWMRGEISIGEHMVPREKWNRVRLKPGIAASFHYPLAGGGGGSGGGKRSKGGLLALVIGIATILTAGAALTGAFASGGFFLAGSASAKVLAGVITVAGQLLSKALSPPPASKPKAETGDDDVKGSASASGNLLEPGAPIPRVNGTMKVFPSMLTQPFTYRVNGDEVVEAVFGLAGPHLITLPKLGSADISGSLDVVYQTREGWDYDSPIDLISRYAVTQQPGIELSTHDVVGDNQQELRNQTVPVASLPIFHGAPSSNMPDQINVDLTFLEGLYDTTDVDAYQRIAFRIRMRNLDTGITYNLPELHYISKTARELRPSVILVWAGLAEVPAMPTNGWATAFYTVPAQASPPMGGWQAHASFFGSGDTYMSRNNQGTSGLIRCYASSSDEFNLHLDEAAIPKGRYQIEIQRSTSVKDADFDPATYQLTGTVRDLFGYIISGSLFMVAKKRVNMADRVGLVRISSVYNTHPINDGLGGSGLAIMAIKATNRAIENFSVVASGYMKDWDGVGWNTITISSNPAVQYHDVFRGGLTPDPLDLEVIDEDTLLIWRQWCIDHNYQCNMICEGDALGDVLDIIASCGYARPRMSDMWGVIRDYDRSAEAPTQIFTAANSFGMTMENEFARLPDALRVSWVDAASDYNTGEEIVYRPGIAETADPRLEQMNYRGLVTKAEAVQRATFDLAQVQARAAKWSFSAATEAVRSTRGDLIGVNHDFINQFHDSGRIIDVIDAGGVITDIVVDREMPVYNEPDMLTLTDMFAVTDMLTVGARTTVQVRQSTGLFSVHRVLGSGYQSQLKLATPYPLDFDDDGRPTVRPDNLVWVGALGTEYKRMIITGISYDKNFMAQIEAVDEAPELWAA